MKRKPFIRSSGAALLYPCVFTFLLLLAGCAGGDKKRQPQGGEKARIETPMGEGIDDDGPEGGNDNEGTMITRSAADSMLSMYALSKAPLLNGSFRGDTLLLPDYEEFSKEMMMRILNQDDVTAVRIYFCMDSVRTKKMKVLIVGRNREGRDVFYTSKEGKPNSGSAPLILEEGNRRP